MQSPRDPLHLEGLPHAEPGAPRAHRQAPQRWRGEAWAHPGYSDLSDGGGEAGQKGSPCFLNLPQTVQNTLSRIPLASRASSDCQPRTAMHLHCLGSAGWFSLSLMTMAAAALNSAWSLRVRQQWLQLQLRGFKHLTGLAAGGGGGGFSCVYLAAAAADEEADEAK